MAPHKKWLFGGIAATVLLFLVGFMLIVNPARNQAAEIQAQAESVEQNNVMLANKLTQLQQQSTEVPAKLEEIAEVQRKMPSEVKQPELVRTIEQEAQSAGVDLTGIGPGTPIALEGSATGTVALPMEITAVGRYANVKTFVDNLENLDRAFLIRTVDVAVEDEAQGSFTLALSGDFFSLPAGTLDTPAQTAPSPTASTTPAPAASAAAKTSPPAKAKAEAKKSTAKSDHHKDAKKAAAKKKSSKKN